jgi:hypothetical protein
MAPESIMRYSLLVQRYRNDKPFQEPFRLGKEMLFPAGYGIRLLFSSPQQGYLYLVNESPVPTRSAPAYNVLFPSSAHNGSSALLLPDTEIPIPPNPDFFRLDNEQGEEKVWIVWAKEAVPELEAVKTWANPQDKGRIKDPIQSNLVTQYLSRFAESRPEIEKDEQNIRTIVRGRSDTLVSFLRLEHH